MKYELRVAGSASAPVPRVETSPPPNEPTQLQRATLRLTGKEGDRFSSQPILRWLVNAIGKRNSFKFGNPDNTNTAYFKSLATLIVPVP